MVCKMYNFGFKIEADNNNIVDINYNFNTGKVIISHLDCQEIAVEHNENIIISDINEIIDGLKHLKTIIESLENETR